MRCSRDTACSMQAQMQVERSASDLFQRLIGTTRVLATTCVTLVLLGVTCGFSWTGSGTANLLDEAKLVRGQLHASKVR